MTPRNEQKTLVFEFMKNGSMFNYFKNSDI